MIRVDQTRVAKKIFESKPKCRRKVGGHRFRWLEDVEGDLPELKVKTWGKTANNRQELAFVVQ